MPGAAVLRLAHQHLFVLVEKQHIVKGHIHLFPLIDILDLLHPVIDDGRYGVPYSLGEGAGSVFEV